MIRRLDLRGAARDAAPGLALVAIFAAAVPRSVNELDGRQLWIVASGVLAVAGTAVLLHSGRSSTTVDRIAFPSPRIDSVRPAVADSSPRISSLIAPGIVSRPIRISLAKRGSSDADNEDSVLVHEASGLVVVSDGASGSFAAADWSAALCQALVDAGFPESVEACVDAISAASTRWLDAQGTVDAPWWAEEGLRRGAFATLLAVQIGRAGWRAVAVGDSCVFHLRSAGDSWCMVHAFPVSSATDFGSHPDLVSSTEAGSLLPTWSHGEMEPNDVMVLATDAVSEWLLSDPSRWSVIAQADEETLAAVIAAARDAGEMVNDDATIVRLTGTGTSGRAT